MNHAIMDRFAWDEWRVSVAATDPERLVERLNQDLEIPSAAPRSMLLYPVFCAGDGEAFAEGEPRGDLFRIAGDLADLRKLSIRHPDLSFEVSTHDEHLFRVEGGSFGDSESEVLELVTVVAAAAAELRKHQRRYSRFELSVSLPKSMSEGSIARTPGELAVRLEDVFAGTIWQDAQEQPQVELVGNRLLLRSSLPPDRRAAAVMRLLGRGALELFGAYGSQPLSGELRLDCLRVARFENALDLFMLRFSSSRLLTDGDEEEPE